MQTQLSIGNWKIKHMSITHVENDLNFKLTLRERHAPLQYQVSKEAKSCWQLVICTRWHATQTTHSHTLIVQIQMFHRKWLVYGVPTDTNQTTTVEHRTLKTDSCCTIAAVIGEANLVCANQTWHHRSNHVPLWTICIKLSFFNLSCLNLLYKSTVGY